MKTKMIFTLALVTALMISMNSFGHQQNNNAGAFTSTTIDNPSVIM